MAPISAIYAITCLANGKRYIGSSKNIRARWREHRGDLARGQHFNKRLQDDWTKHGAEAFQFEILEVVEHRLLTERERHWMGPEFSGYNRTLPDLSQSKWTASKDMRLEMSMSRKGRPPWNKGQTMSPEARRKISDAQRGRPRSEETKRKISAGLKGRASPLRGRRLSAETRAKISQAHKGRVMSAEWRHKNSEAHKGKPALNKGRPMSDDQKRKLSEAAKRRYARMKQSE